MNYKFNTKAIHSLSKNNIYNETVVPIVQSSSFQYRTAEELEEIFKGKKYGYIYSRISNPTVYELEERINFLEDGRGAVATSSGMAAITVGLLNILKADDHLLSSTSLFGGTFSLFNNIFKRYGIEVDFVDMSLPKNVEEKIKINTKAIFLEVIGNPKLDVIDIRKISKIAHESHIPLFIDNTIPTPYLLKGKDYGADVVIHSTTKFINGFGNSIGGILIDTGNYDWVNEKFPNLQEYTKKYGEFAYLSHIKHDVYRDFGTCMSPFNAFLTILGLETLGIRMEIHCKNALKLAEYLEKHPKVKEINYPGLKSSKYHSIASEQFNNKFCSLLTFRLGNKERSFKFINGLRLAKNLANLGDAKTLVIHPASTIYADISQKEKETAGVFDDMVRVSVGIEDIEDIITDFENSLSL